MPPKSKHKPFTNRFVKDDDTDEEYVYTRSGDKNDNYGNDMPITPKRK